MHLLIGTLGGVLGWLALTGLALIPIVVLFVTVTAVRVSQRALEEPALATRDRRRRGASTRPDRLQQLVPPAFERWRPVPLRTSQMLVDEWREGRVMLADRAEFERQAADDPFRKTPADRLLTGLGGVDVLLIYIESYGRSALEEERYAELLLPRLATFERRLADAGLVAASGYLTSPTMGGQSWLAHGTLESGLWITDQRLYDLLVASDRLTLTKAFDRAGRRTVTVRPAITMDWPEGPMLGYQKIYAARDLGYQGKPYNWITMPDQYTLAAFERRERERPHAPLYRRDGADQQPRALDADPAGARAVVEDRRWPGVLAVGGGRRSARRWSGAIPERVRAQYALAIDYVLGVLASYSARFVDDQTLLILVGDHQPAPLITGAGASRDVPMHVISGAPGLLEPVPPLRLHARNAPRGAGRRSRAWTSSGTCSSAPSAGPMAASPMALPRARARRRDRAGRVLRRSSRRGDAPAGLVRPPRGRPASSFRTPGSRPTIAISRCGAPTARATSCATTSRADDGSSPSTRRRPSAPAATAARPRSASTGPTRSARVGQAAGDCGQELVVGVRLLDDRAGELHSAFGLGHEVREPGRDQDLERVAAGQRGRGLDAVDVDLQHHVDDREPRSMPLDQADRLIGAAGDAGHAVAGSVE